MSGKCKVCSGKVKSGGNIHEDGHHAFTPRHGEHHAAKLRARRRKRGGGETSIKRGVVVGGLKKGGAKSGENRK